MKHCWTFVIIFLLLLSCFSSEARTGRRDVPLFTYGLEWSYSAIFNVIWHHNFYTEYGRVNDKDTRGFYESNGEILAHAGINLGKKVNLSLYSGYSGSLYNVRIVPFSLRLTCFYGNDSYANRWFSYIDGGNGIPVTRMHTSYYAGKIGGGYRISLSRSVKLDFNLAYRLSYISPDIYEYGEKIPENNIYRNDNYLSTIMLGVGLTF